MRIVLSNSSSKWGGLHAVTEMLARGLQSRGHDVTLFGYPGSPLEMRMRGVVPFEAVGKGMDVSPFSMSRSMFALKRRRTQVVLAMTKKDVRRTVPAARMLGIPSIIRHANDRPLGMGYYDRFFFGMLPVRHVTNSQSTRRTLLRSAPWLSPDAVDVVYNGIDPRPYDEAPKADLDLPRGAIAIGFVGRLERRKGILDLAAAWPSISRELPTAHLVITGNGREEGEARDLLRGSPRVRWLGYRSDVPSVLKALDVLVMPSHWEGFGLVAAEALLAGTAVVAANASSLPEIIADGEHGLLVPAGDLDSLSSAVRALAGDPALRLRLAAAGRSRVISDFSPDRMVARFEEILTAVARKAD